MDDKKKKYLKPDAEVVSFPAEDVIVTSLVHDEADAGFVGEDWGEEAA